MSEYARGTFEVSMQPVAGDEGADATLGRMLLSKTFSGDLQASGDGQMLTAMGEVAGSAAYVAIERVSGQLHGRQGSFALVHRGVMSGDQRQLQVEIVPDSGRGELAGIRGQLDIRIEAGQHFYELAYTL
ncbi:DUF3224 domain-containing protein [Pseudoxanthomonas dokdonensis]|uniref:DUF3224 domain-containing protein n=1 Tax=Pseudoxanthomonas dokdonensis TaxID=344882 RepID=A0A0R0CQ15_9GAMM|nr:DUF3224 domain-containing protein [Pseudoxanthomonas dokdonensis]KRG71669.1 hypothetical protein ABB29_02660 [Pseudoxanthomonas dokdonensis]